MTFSKDTKLAICRIQNGYCKADGCYNKVHSIHHKCRNTAYNRERFKLFIHSVINGVGLCFSCHRDKSHEFRITDNEAMMIENFLRNLTEGVF